MTDADFNGQEWTIRQFDQLFRRDHGNASEIRRRLSSYLIHYNYSYLTGALGNLVSLIVTSTM